MDLFKYNLYLTQLLLAINNNKDINNEVIKLNSLLENFDENSLLMFLSQFTNNTIKLFNFNKIEQVEEYVGNFQTWLNNFSCLKNIIDVHTYSFLVQYIIITKIYYSEMDEYFKDQFLNNIIDNINNIPNKVIKVKFLDYVLEYYLRQGISLIYRNTLDKVTDILDKLLGDKLFEDNGMFNLPLLESEIDK